MIQGSPSDDKFVTSYKVLYSEDGVKFSYIVDEHGQNEIFNGPVDTLEPAVQILDRPIEAKIVRINPHTWHNGIAIRAELIGCQTPTGTEEESEEEDFETYDTAENVRPVSGRKMVHRKGGKTVRVGEGSYKSKAIKPGKYSTCAHN